MLAALWLLEFWALIRLSSPRPIAAPSCSSLLYFCPLLSSGLAGSSTVVLQLEVHRARLLRAVIRCLSFGLDLVALVHSFWFGMTRHGKDVMALVCPLYYTILSERPILIHFRCSPKSCAFQGSGEVLWRRKAFSKS